MGASRIGHSGDVSAHNLRYLPMITTDASIYLINLDPKQLALKRLSQL